MTAGRAWLAVVAVTIAAEAVAAAPAYRAYRDGLLVADLPAGSRQVEPGSFRYLHDGIGTEFSFASSVPHVDERQPDCAGRRPSYLVDRADLFAFSCEVSGSIRYHVARYGRSYREGAGTGTELIEFSIRYPAAQRSFWDPVVAHMSRSLRFAK